MTCLNRRKVKDLNFLKKLSIAAKSRPPISREIILRAAEKRKGWRHSPEALDKISKANKGKVVSEETKRKQRIAYIKFLEKRGGKVRPNFNPKACEYFKNLNEIGGFNGRHALNGGEFYLKSDGYFLDFYDQEHNLVIEWDEPRHYYSDGTLKTKDLIRQNNIIKALGCDFYRYSERTGKSKRVNTNLNSIKI